MNEKTITITKAQYDEAVKTVMENEMNDPSLEGMAKLLIPMTGAIFTSKVGAVLFGKGGANNG